HGRGRLVERVKQHPLLHGRQRSDVLHVARVRSHERIEFGLTQLHECEIGETHASSLGRASVLDEQNELTLEMGYQVLYRASTMRLGTEGHRDVEPLARDEGVQLEQVTPWLLRIVRRSRTFGGDPEPGFRKSRVELPEIVEEHRRLGDHTR